MIKKPLKIVVFDFYKFKCKKGQKLLPMKGTKKVLKKFSKKIGFNTTKKTKKINRFCNV